MIFCLCEKLLLSSWSVVSRKVSPITHPVATTDRRYNIPLLLLNGLLVKEVTSELCVS
jgi:hypothetical protein